MKYIYYLSFYFLDALLTVLFLPVYVVQIVITLFSSRKKNRVAIFAGLEHVIDKSVVRGNVLEGEGFKVIFYSFEHTGYKCSPKYKPYLIKAPALLALDLFTFLNIIIKHNPAYIEIYFEGFGIAQLLYTILSRVNNSYVIAILRGEIHSYFTGFSSVRRFSMKYTLKLCNYIFYRELYMPEILKKLSIPENKTYFDHNSVSVRNEPSYEKKQKLVLFLNGMKKFRRIEILISAIPQILKCMPDVKFILCGARIQEERDFVNGMIKSLNIENTVELHDWTSEPADYYNKASVFVLPSDRIYCNFSLLEAMERGVPAIVADTDDADKIVSHGINGYLVKQIPEQFAQYIMDILSDEERRIEMGKNARKTIIEKYNDINRMKPIIKLITNRV